MIWPSQFFGHSSFFDFCIFYSSSNFPILLPLAFFPLWSFGLYWRNFGFIGFFQFFLMMDLVDLIQTSFLCMEGFSIWLDLIYGDEQSLLCLKGFGCPCASLSSPLPAQNLYHSDSDEIDLECGNNHDDNSWGEVITCVAWSLLATLWRGHCLKTVDAISHFLSLLFHLILWRKSQNCRG